MVYSFGFAIQTAQFERAAHPDSLCPRIAQQTVARALIENPDAKVDANVTVGDKAIYIGGQIRPDELLKESEIADIVRQEIFSVGYNGLFGYDVNGRQIIVDMSPQSPNINGTVVNGNAGDTLTKLGYATMETKERLPLEHILAKEMAHRLDHAFKEGSIYGLGPDGKINLAVRYGRGNAYAEIVVIAAQHTKDTEMGIFRRDIIDNIVIPTLGKLYDPSRTRIIIDGADQFQYGGPVVDRGVKGEKDASFMYGDRIGHTGGSAFGKDPTKVDFHAIVLARHIAKSLVENGVADEMTVKLMYAMGEENPPILDFAAQISDFEREGLKILVERNFPLARDEVIRELNLREPSLYPQTATHGFFGKADFPWEKVRTIK